MKSRKHLIPQRFIRIVFRQSPICRRRLVVRTGRCGRPDGGSILPGDTFLRFDTLVKTHGIQPSILSIPNLQLPLTKITEALNLFLK